MLKENIRMPVHRLIIGGTIALIFGAGIVRAQDSHPDFTGIWSGSFTTQDNDFWGAEDFTACFAGCTPASREHLLALFDDPANDDQSVRELWDQTVAFMRQELAAKATPEGLALQNANTTANDPTILCKPYGIVRQAASPLPMAVRRDGENLVLDYEEWNLSRTVYMDDRSEPADLTSTPLGHSVGSYEGNVLVISSSGIEGDIYYSFQSGGGYSDQVSVDERYTIHDNPRRLVLEMTVTDPVTLTEPHLTEKIWLWTPDVEMIEDSCGDIPGQP